jgi:hypothetical protein
LRERHVHRIFQSLFRHLQKNRSAWFLPPLTGMAGGRKRVAALEARVKRLEAELQHVSATRRGGGAKATGHDAHSGGGTGGGIWAMSCSRASWLLLFLASLSFTAIIMGQFEHV